MTPNYIAQMNGFNKWLDAHYLSPHAQLLWFRMIGLFNACGWADRVQIDTNRLMTLSGTGSNKAAYNARDALVEAGLLTYQKGKKGKPSQYRMVYFPCSGDTKYDTESDTVSAQKTERDSAHNNKHKPRQNETKENSKEESDAFVPPEALAEAWQSYAQMRARNRKPVSDEQARQLLRELDKLEPHDYKRQSQILNRSAMFGWQGLFPLPDDADEPPPSYDIAAFERQLWEMDIKK